MKELIGTGVALVTPFKENGEVDHQALARIVEHNITGGVDYLVISGTTGESVTITRDEKHAIVQTIIDANKGRKPLVLGIGGNNTAAIIDELESTDLDPFTAVLSVSPYYSKPTQDGLYEHFKAVAKHSPKPIILYNVPGRTSKNMEPHTTLRLANEVSNIVAIKEAGNSVHQYLELLKDKPKDFHVISGDDDLALGAVLAGGSGVISVVGQAVPNDFSRMINYGLEGKAKEAYALHFKLMDLTAAVFAENNPAGIKAVLNALGLCDSRVRLPLVEASDKLKSEIKSIISEINS